MKTRFFFLGLSLMASLAVSSQEILPYQNPELPVEQRVDDLLSRLTLEEKTQLMMNGSPAIPRLGLPQFDWWSEALHGVGRNGLSTVFPQCIGMACSFDDALLEMVCTAVSDEARAKNNELRRQGKAVGKYQGLSFWTPTINIFRDPRWGRGQESYGEDPYQNGRMGSAVVRGLQGPGEKYYKLLACAKHFAVHSGPEKTRHHFNIDDLPARDLWETYLPAFRDLVQKAGVEEVMCAYQRFEGDPCCGSNRLLQQILRRDWGFKGLVVSDCGAIGDFYREGRHGVSRDSKAAAARGVISGTDVECGSVYKNLPDAVRRGDISEEQINTSVRRLLRGRFLLGDLDPDSLVGWTDIPASVVNCKDHRELALLMAREQMVLLKNNGVLPLKPIGQLRTEPTSPNSSLQTPHSKIMVMGPNAADSLVMWGIYYGQPAHTVTALEGIETRLGRKVPFRQACDITAMTENHSIFDQLRDDSGRPGMSARYWNNTHMEGNPVVTTTCTSPLNFDNGGNTAFAAGVSLTNFTASYRGTFTAQKTEELQMVLANDDGLRVIVNGDTLQNRWNTNRLNHATRKLKVKAGEQYTVQLDYLQLEGGATLGFDIQRHSETTIDQIVASAADAETVIFVGGISPLLEREEASVHLPGFDGGDRSSIELPRCQRDILRALHEAGKKVVFVNMSGSAVALTPEVETCDAILQAWYPGEQGGNAIAHVLFGDYNPSGKLAVTFYRDDSQLPPFDEYRMTGRTYRYFRGQPLFPFGYGLSYTTFRLGDASVKRMEYVDEDTNAKRPVSASYQAFNISVPVTNTGQMEGAEVIQVYLRRPADTAGPLKTLRGYQRVTLKPGQTKTVNIAMSRDDFETWDETTGTMRVIGGDYELMVGTSSDARDLQTVKVTL